MSPSLRDRITKLFEIADMGIQQLVHDLPPELVVIEPGSQQKVWRVALQNMGKPTPTAHNPEHYDARWFHATTPIGAVGILTSRRIEPMAEQLGGSGSHGFYAKGYLVDASHAQWNHERWVATSYKAWSSSKNHAYMIFEGTARGLHKTSNGGGVGHDMLLVSRTQWVHLWKEKRWCFHRDCAEIQAVLFDENLTLPGALSTVADQRANAGHRKPP